MEKIETLLKIETENYATPKKLNRSNVKIPDDVIQSIIAGDVTCEILDRISSTVPVFKYKTCITLHGLFDLGPILPRIGGYVNLIQNKNGSLEIRYNAIDLDKKKRISRVLRECESEFRFFIDSTGTEFQSKVRVDTKSDFETALRDYRAIAEKIGKIDFYGKCQVWKAKGFFGETYVVCSLIANAIPDNSVGDIMRCLTGLSDAEILTATENAIQKEKDREIERLASIEQSKIEAEKTAKAKDSLQSEIDGLPAFTLSVGNTGVRTLTAAGQAYFQVIRIKEKASFGRFKYQFANIKTLADMQKVNFRDSIRLIKPKEFPVSSYRSIQM